MQIIDIISDQTALQMLTAVNCKPRCAQFMLNDVKSASCTAHGGRTRSRTIETREQIFSAAKSFGGKKRQGRANSLGDIGKYINAPKVALTPDFGDTIGRVEYY